MQTIIEPAGSAAHNIALALTALALALAGYLLG